MLEQMVPTAHARAHVVVSGGGMLLHYRADLGFRIMTALFPSRGVRAVEQVVLEQHQLSKEQIETIHLLAPGGTYVVLPQ